jgi:MFS family permease
MDDHAPRRRALALLCLASAAWGFAFGLGLPVGAVWMRDAGWSAAAVGLSTSAYYLGVAVASPLLPWLMRRLGRAAVVVGMALDGLVTLLFPYGGGPVAWQLLRLTAGVATASCLVPMETAVGRNAAPGRRARDFGWYAFSVALGVGLGPVVGLPLYAHAPRLAFAVAGLVALLASGLAAQGVPAHDDEAPASSAGGSWSWGPAVLLALGSAWAQGFLEGGMLTFLSPYLLALGHGELAVSGLLGALFLGVVLAQLPCAWLADRLGGTRVLLGCHAVVLGGLALLPWLLRPLGLSAGLFAVGACCAALYPLGLALLSERVSAAALARANAWYLACNCAGSLAGPWLTGLAIDRWGWPGLFASAVVPVVLAVGLWAALRARPAAAPAVAERRAAGVQSRKDGSFSREPQASARALKRSPAARG